MASVFATKGVRALTIWLGIHQMFPEEHLKRIIKENSPQIVCDTFPGISRM